MTIRTRFAPSPTGYLHVGGIRTALFAFLVARQAGGQFVLRLEDTDKKREVAGSAEHLIASLKALGLQYDEGPDISGPYGPYKQSKRLDIYRRYAEELIEQGRAYADPYTPEEIQAFREQAQAAKRAFRYRDHRPENPPEWNGSQPLRFRSEPRSYTYHDEIFGDVTTSPEVVDDFILIKSDGYPTYNFAHIIDDLEMHITHVIRGQEFISSMPNYLALYEALGFDMNAPVAQEDGVGSKEYGETASTNRQVTTVEPPISAHSESLTDSADVSDDSRSEARDSAGRHDDSGGVEAGVTGTSTLDRKLPIFAHMPHIMNEQGNKKLGKRDGAKDVLDYIRDGYLPEALDSFIATMGWNDGTEQEVFTMDELIEKFSLSRVQRSGARFDEKRLLWVNGHFIRELSLDELVARVNGISHPEDSAFPAVVRQEAPADNQLAPNGSEGGDDAIGTNISFWPEAAKKSPEDYKRRILALAQDRLKTLKDLPGLTSYFFEEPTPNMTLITDNKQLKKLSPDEIKSLLQQAHDALEQVSDWTPEAIQDVLNHLLETTGSKPGILFSLIRIATTWAPFSPQLGDTLSLLGRERTLARLQHVLSK